MAGSPAARLHRIRADLHQMLDESRIGCARHRAMV
jgi:hypothetical protein